MASFYIYLYSISAKKINNYIKMQELHLNISNSELGYLFMLQIAGSSIILHLEEYDKKKKISNTYLGAHLVKLNAV